MVVLCRFEPRRSDLLRRGLFLDLLLDEGQTIGALIDCRVAFMGADADFIEGTVILAAAVVVALAHMALDGVVSLFVCKTHTKHPPFLRYGLSMHASDRFMLEKFLSAASAETASSSAKASAAAAAGSGASAKSAGARAGSGTWPRTRAVVMMVREQRAQEQARPEAAASAAARAVGARRQLTDALVIHVIERIERRLVAVMMVVNLAGCGKFDAAAYVESCLDLLTKGETEQYMKMTGRSKEQAESDYESNIDAMMTEMDQFNLSDELSNSYRQLFKDVYAKAKYTVKDAEKMDDKDGYYVTVEIEQMTGLFNGIQEELMTEFTEWANSFDADTYPTEDEMYEQMYQMMYDLMSARLDSITYNDPQEVVVEVIGEDNVYSISDGSMTELDEALLDVATE